MRDTPHPILFGIFSAFLLVPAFFWVGGKLFHMRIDTMPLAAALFVIMILFWFRKK